MKPARFDYEAPGSLRAALELLGSDGAIPLAGGQSLVPMLNMRLARPTLLVDLNGIAELARVHVEGRALRIGALTRQLAVERSHEVRRGWPLVEQAVRSVGHVAIRARGTVGGSAAHADPRAELPAALLALGARFHLRSSRGERTVPADDFFRGPFRTALEAGELLTEIELPPLPAGARTAFAERARTHGAFAIAGAAVVAVPGGPCAIALGGVGPVPTRARCAEEALSAGAPPGEVAQLAASDVRGGHRRALVAALVGQALVSAVRE